MEKLSAARESAGERDYDKQHLREVGKFFLETEQSVESAVERTSAVVGVEIGVKPAGLVGFSYDPERNDEQRGFEDALQAMDIKYIRQAQGAYQHYFISKDAELAEELQETFAELWAKEDKNQISETDLKLGRLLGYPETAVDYVMSGRAKAVDELQKRPDTLLVHDPEHFEEEYEAYEKPIYEAMDVNCLELAVARKRQQNGHLGGKIVGLLRKLGRK